MIETINILLLKKFEESHPPDKTGESIASWLTRGQNYQRLHRECDKIWANRFENESYDTERAFKLLGQRLLGICKQETFAK